MYAAFEEWFGKEQLLASNDALVNELQSSTDLLPLLDGTSHILGPVACADGTLDIYTAPLATAPEGFKVAPC